MTRIKFYTSQKGLSRVKQTQYIICSGRSNWECLQLHVLLFYYTQDWGIKGETYRQHNKSFFPEISSLFNKDILLGQEVIYAWSTWKNKNTGHQFSQRTWVFSYCHLTFANFTKFQVSWARPHHKFFQPMVLSFTMAKGICRL